MPGATSPPHGRSVVPYSLVVSGLKVSVLESQSSLAPIFWFTDVGFLMADHWNE